MGEVLISFDYGRRAEYLTSYALSPYALTVPIRGHDDRVESDFLCVGFEQVDKSFIPNLKLMFWVQTKSQSAKTPSSIIISSPSKVESILNNRMPYFIAIVNTKTAPTISLYGTGERVAFKHMHPYLTPTKIRFVPRMPKQHKMYYFDESKQTAVIYMGKPFLEFTVAKNYDRINEYWETLRDKIQKEYNNFIYASAGLGIFERESPPWEEPGPQTKIFFPSNGKLTNETMKSVGAALTMLKLTCIAEERRNNPNSELVRAFDIVVKHFANST